MMFDVLTIGSATRDVFIKSGDFHIDPDHHVLGGRGLVMPLGAKISIEKIVFTTGGGSTNTAATFSRQGFKTGIICMVGNDVSGQAVLEEMREEGINTGFVKKNKDIGTAYSVLLHPAGGERTVLVYRGASEYLRFKDIPLGKIKTSWLYISSVGGHFELLRPIILFAKRNNIHIAYNPGAKELRQRRKLIPLLKYADILIVNRDEAAVITGVSFQDHKKIFRVCDEMSPGMNVMTDAKNGVMVSDGRFLYSAGIYKERAVIDRTGAGDAFGSGFVSGIMRKMPRSGNILTDLSEKDIEYAIRLGSANATAKVEGIGPKFGLLTRKEFERGKRWRKFPIIVSKI